MDNVKQKRAYQAIAKDHQNLFRFIRFKISSPEESEDLLQEVYVQALSNLNAFETIDNISAWLFTIAKNKVIDWYRKKRIKTVSLEEPAGENVCFKDIVEDEMRNIESQLDREYVMNEIMSAIDDLPEKQKYVFINNVVEERTFRELSEETGEPINTLIARKRYAVRFLQSRLIEIKKLIDKN